VTWTRTTTRGGRDDLSPQSHPCTRYPEGSRLMLHLGVLLVALASGPVDDKQPKAVYRPDLFETLVNPACSHCVDEARRKAGALFDCLTGLAFDGPRKGEQLAAIPTVETDWGPWLKANPGTVAYAMVAKFQPQSAPKVSLPESRKTRPEPDPRLAADERVF